MFHRHLQKHCGCPGRLCRIPSTLPVASRLLIILLATQVAGWAQSTVRLEGRVYDRQSGSPLSGAVVQFSSEIYGAAADDAGRFVVENVPPGDYRIEVTMAGYRPESREVHVREDVAEILSIGLEPQPVALDTVAVWDKRQRFRQTLEGQSIVLDQAVIRRQKSLGITHLLRQAGGIEVVSESGSGTAKLQIHGSAASQVLVLLDGQRLNNPQTGDVDLNQIPLDLVEEIKVIPHGNTAMYGGDAYAGVVAFSTRNSRPGRSLSLRSEGGSFQSAEGAGSLHLPLGEGGLLLNYLQGYSRQNFPYRYEGQEYHRANAYTRSRKSFGKFQQRFGRHQFSLRYQWRENERGLPSAFFEEMAHWNAFVREDHQAFYGQYQWLAHRSLIIRGSLGSNVLDQHYVNVNDPSPFTRYDVRQKNRLDEASVKAVMHPGRLTEIRAGWEYLEEQLEQDNRIVPQFSFGNKKRFRRAVFAALEQRLEFLNFILKDVNLNAAMRLEKAFGIPLKGYPQVGAGFKPAVFPAAHLGFVWGKAIRYPDFNSLFWKGDARSRGNPDLQPERKQFWNATVNIQPESKWLPSLQVFFYRESLRDLIFWHRGVNGVWEPRNEESARKTGFDIHLSHSPLPGVVAIRAVYSYISAINKSPEPNRFGRQIVFIPRHTLNNLLSLTIGETKLDVNTRYVSEREVTAANTGDALDPYWLFDLQVGREQRFKHFRAEASFGIRNLGNENYQLLRGYPMPGRTYLLNLTLKYES